MGTVTTKPEYGTVEYYADLIRRNAGGDWGTVRICALAVVGTTAAEKYATDADKLGRIHNIMAAVDLVHAEMQTAR